MFAGRIFSIAMLLSATAAMAAEAELRVNPALPSPTDMVTFAEDAEPALPVALDSLDADGANQGVFPAYYGTLPPMLESLAAPDSEPETAAPAAPAAPARIPEPAPGPPPVELPPMQPDNAPLPEPPPPGLPVPELPVNEPESVAAAPAPAQPAEQPGIPPAAPVEIDMDRLRADFNDLKTFTDADSLGSAAEVYARMPDFGANGEANRLRADAANLLVLGLARADNLSAARRIYESVPVDMAGDDATLAKARSIVNLATYYVRAERHSDAYDILMDIGKIRNRSILNTELFRLMARMIPYLDNADQTEKAASVYDLLLGEVTSPGAAALFAENVPGVFKYYLHYVDKSESPRNRRKRLDFLEHAFASMDRFPDNPDIRLARKNLGESLAARYAGDPERAARFYVED